jgi:hypothetical protein
LIPREQTGGDLDLFRERQIAKHHTFKCGKEKKDGSPPETFPADMH